MFKKFMISTILATGLFAGDYTLDMAHSGIGFSVKHLMISNVKGKFTNFNGNFSFDEKKNIIQKLDGTVEVMSINTEIQKRDDHLRSADFFDAAQFPKMTLVMTKFVGGKKPKVIANLTIKNITKSVTFDADIGGYAKDQDENEKVGLSLTSIINRKDFGLNWNKTMETGGFVVGDEVKISIDLEGNKK